MLFFPDDHARVVLDLTQTIGAYPIDISRLAPDFMVAAGYKWQFCPYGVAFLYVDERHIDGVPIEEAWMGRSGAEDFSRLAVGQENDARRHLIRQPKKVGRIATEGLKLLLKKWPCRKNACRSRSRSQRSGSR